MVAACNFVFKSPFFALLRHGAKDPLVPEHHPRWFHETIPNSKLHIFPERGDPWGCLALIHWECPKKKLKGKKLGPDFSVSDPKAMFLDNLVHGLLFPIGQLVFFFCLRIRFGKPSGGQTQHPPEVCRWIQSLGAGVLQRMRSVCFRMGLTIGWARSERF